MNNKQNDRGNTHSEVSKEAAETSVEEGEEIKYAYALITKNNADVAATMDGTDNNNQEHRNRDTNTIDKDNDHGKKNNQTNRNTNMNNINNNANNNNRDNNNNDDELTDDVKNKIADIVQSVD